jgi:hypothetical protein
MSENAKLNREVFDKQKFKDTVDTSFSQLSSKPDPKFFDLDLATLKDFWLLYDKFFYDIPKLGEIESHEYLSKTSGEYANSNKIQAEVQALLDEISTLREENLTLRKENIDNLTSSLTNSEKAVKISKKQSIRKGLGSQNQ